MKMMVMVTLIGMSVASGVEPRQPRVVTLYKDQIADVYVSDKVTTVLQFEEEVTTVTGAGLSDGTQDAQVQLDHPKDSKMIVLRSMGKEGPAFMQVMSGGEFYAFRLVQSEQPDSVVRLSELPKEAQAVASTVSSITLPEDRIQGIVALAKKSFEGKQVPGIEARRVHNLRADGAVQTLVEMVARSAEHDVIVLKGLITNSGTADLRFSDSEATLVVAGSRTVSPVRFQPDRDVVRPGERTGFVLVVVGDGSGVRANLSVKNRFELSLVPGK